MTVVVSVDEAVTIVADLSDQQAADSVEPPDKTKRSSSKVNLTNCSIMFLLNRCYC